MSVTVKVIRNSGIDFPTYVSMDDKETFLALVLKNQLHILKPVLSISHERKRQKLIDAIAAKAKRKYGIATVVDEPETTLSLDKDGVLMINRPQTDSLGVTV